jgi:hypothetical protein
MPAVRCRAGADTAEVRSAPRRDRDRYDPGGGRDSLDSATVP